MNCTHPSITHDEFSRYFPLLLLLLYSPLLVALFESGSVTQSSALATTARPNINSADDIETQRIHSLLTIYLN